MANIQIDIAKNGKTTLDTKGKFCEDYIDVNVNVTAEPPEISGTIDADKNIILTGDLEDGVYSIRYTTADGSQTYIDTFSVGNMVPQSINADGSDFVGENNEDGYIVGYRLNSSGTIVAQSGCNATGFIPVNPKDTVYIDGMQWVLGSSTAWDCYFCIYDSDFNHIYGGQGQNLGENITKTIVTDETGQVISVTFDDSVRTDLLSMAYIRVSFHPIDGEEPVLKVNTPIVSESEENT